MSIFQIFCNKYSKAYLIVNEYTYVNVHAGFNWWTECSNRFGSHEVWEWFEGHIRIEGGT